MPGDQPARDDRGRWAARPGRRRRNGANPAEPETGQPGTGQPDSEQPGAATPGEPAPGPVRAPSSPDALEQLRKRLMTKHRGRKR